MSRRKVFQKIFIRVRTTTGETKRVKILRSNLKNYLRDAQKIWYKPITKLRKIKRKDYEVKEIFNEEINKQTIIFKFNMKRKIIREGNIEKRILECYQKYKKVQKARPEFNAQWIIAEICDKPASYYKKGKKKIENVSVIATTTFERNEKSTPYMFQELGDKIRAGFEGELSMEEGGSGLLFDEDLDQSPKGLKTFSIVFTQN